MAPDFDSLSILMTNAAKAFEMLVAWSNMYLMRFGLDATTIIARGPTLVLIGLALAAIRYASSRMFSAGGERQAFAYYGLNTGRAKARLVYVVSDRHYRERLAGAGRTERY